MSALIDPTAPKPMPKRRPTPKRLVMLIRRGHLYFGLFLFPWALLYGVTAFLFNHPTAFSDRPIANFGADTLAGTALETRPTPLDQACEVVNQLNASQTPATPYQLIGDAKYGREFAFATVKADGQTISVLLDAKNGGGTIRSSPVAEVKQADPAPFVVGSPAKPRPREARNNRQTARPNTGGEPRLTNSLHERFRDALPTILARTGFPTGEITVTSVPDVVFTIRAEGRDWMANYNPMTGTLAGTPAGSQPASELSWRRFLLRLHTAHGYPGEANGRWFWALVVDAMAFTLCFWSLSGLLMWWQIKATRRLGAGVLMLSGLAATALGFAMHAAMTG